MLQQQLLALEATLFGASAAGEAEASAQGERAMPEITLPDHAHIAGQAPECVPMALVLPLGLW